MKKILAMLLVLAMVFAQAACGQQAAPAASGGAPRLPAARLLPLRRPAASSPAPMTSSFGPAKPLSS